MTEKPQVDFEEVVKASGMPVTEEEIRDRFNAIATEEGIITNTSRMSPFWRLVTAIVTAPVMWLKEVLISTVLANMFVATASGSMLRLLAWAVNITPKPASAAQGVIRFYKEDASAVVTVKAGTVIQTERINGRVYELAITEDVVIASGTASALLPVKATGTGGAYNLAPGYYRILPVAVDGISHVASEENWLAGTGGNTDVVIMMVTGQTHENFMKGLNSLVDVFPAPAFTQVRRLAESAATLATEKMQIPAKVGAGLPVAIPLSVPTSRAALSAAAVSEAQKAAGAGFSLDGLKQQLGEFTQLRDSLINDVASGLADLQGKSARAWVFTASGDTAATLLALVKDIPQPSAVYTAAIMLAGKNLDGIRGMIHDVDPDTGA
ncbi:hypothetical protein ITP12_003784 [Salmonella enterica]|nr:hypothetical protein [Salmonella enterica]